MCARVCACTCGCMCVSVGITGRRPDFLGRGTKRKEREKHERLGKSGIR